MYMLVLFIIITIIDFGCENYNVIIVYTYVVCTRKGLPKHVWIAPIRCYHSTP